MKDGCDLAILCLCIRQPLSSTCVCYGRLHLPPLAIASAQIEWNSLRRYGSKTTVLQDHRLGFVMADYTYLH